MSPQPSRRKQPAAQCPDGGPAGAFGLQRDTGAGNWFASTLARGLALMGAFRESDVDGVQAGQRDGEGRGWLGNAELARRTQLPRSTVSRLGAELVGLGYLQRNPQGRLRPGPRLLRHVYPMLRGLPIRELARPHLQALAEQIDGVVALAALDGVEVVLVEVAGRPRRLAAHPDEGFQVPLIQVAAGRALLAVCDESRRALLLGQLRRQYPPLWLQHREQSFAAIDACLVQGHCSSPDALATGSVSLALPLLTLADGLPLAMNCQLAGRRATARALRALAPQALAVAHVIRAEWAASSAAVRGR